MPVTISDDVLSAAGLSESDVRQALAVPLFREDRLTLAQAARLAEVDLFTFQDLLAARNISLHYGIDEFCEDLETARWLR